jgi:hypothetical protein
MAAGQGTRADPGNGAEGAGLKHSSATSFAASLRPSP